MRLRGCAGCVANGDDGYGVAGSDGCRHVGGTFDECCCGVYGGGEPVAVSTAAIPTVIVFAVAAVM